MKINHRQLAATLVLALGFSISAAQAEIKLKLSHFVPPVIGLHTEFMQPWADELETCSGGEVSVEIHPAGSALGHIAKQYDQARAGVSDVAFGLAGIPRGRFPRTSLIELPFMTHSADAASRALWNIAQSHLKAEYQEVKILAMMTHNPGAIHTTKPLGSLADLKGLRIRTPNPSISAILEHYGAEAVGLPPTQIYENLQKGTIDGVAIDWNGVNAFKLSEVVSHHFEMPLYTAGFYFIMNQKKYDSLPDKVRACVDQISGEALVARFGGLWDKWDAAGREKVAADSSKTIRTATAEEVAATKAALQPVTDALLKAASDAGVDDVSGIVDALKAEIAKH